MTTHPLQFGRTSNTPGHVHSHAGSMPQHKQIGNHFVTVKQKETGDEEHKQLVKQTQKWVAQTFYGEMLKQMHKSPFKDKIFSGGRGGEAFQEMFDQKLAEKMSSGSGRRLVDVIVRRLEARKAYGHGEPATSQSDSNNPLLTDTKKAPMILPHKTKRPVTSITYGLRQRAGTL